MLLFAIDKHNFVESLLFVNFVLIDNLGILAPISFYVKDKDLRNHVRRDILHL